MFLILACFGCQTPYIVERGELNRLNNLPKKKWRNALLYAVHEEVPAPRVDAAPRPPPERVILYAQDLNFSKGTWIDPQRMRVPTRRPIAMLVLGAVGIATGIILAGLAGANEADQSCNRKYGHSDLACLPRALGTTAYAISAGVVGIGGVVMTLVAGKLWNPDELPLHPEP